MPAGDGLVFAQRHAGDSWPGISVRFHPESSNSHKEFKIVWSSDASPPVDWTWEDNVNNLITQLKNIQPDLEAGARKVEYLRCFRLPLHSTMPHGVGVEHDFNSNKFDFHNHATMFAAGPQRARLTMSEQTVDYIHIPALAETPLNWNPHSIVRMSFKKRKNSERKAMKKRVIEGKKRIQEQVRHSLAGDGEEPGSSSRGSSEGVPAPSSGDSLSWADVGDALQAVFYDSHDPLIIDQAEDLVEDLDIDEEGKRLAPQELREDGLRDFARRVHRVLLAFRNSKDYRAQKHHFVSKVGQQIKGLFAEGRQRSSAPTASSSKTAQAEKTPPSTAMDDQHGPMVEKSQRSSAPTASSSKTASATAQAEKTPPSTAMDGQHGPMVEKGVRALAQTKNPFSASIALYNVWTVVVRLMWQEAFTDHPDLANELYMHYFPRGAIFGTWLPSAGAVFSSKKLKRDENELKRDETKLQGHLDELRSGAQKLFEVAAISRDTLVQLTTSVVKFCYNKAVSGFLSKIDHRIHPSIIHHRLRRYIDDSFPNTPTGALADFAMQVKEAAGWSFLSWDRLRSELNDADFQFFANNNTDVKSHS